MAVGKAKKFEELIKNALSQVPDLSFDRLFDPAGGYYGIRNISDFYGYIYPIAFYLECKTTAGNSLPFKNITETQLSGMLEKSNIRGMAAGIAIWFYEKDVTIYVDIRDIKNLIDEGKKSISLTNLDEIPHIKIKGTKKRFYFDYDGNDFIKSFTMKYLSELINKELIRFGGTND